MLYSHASKSFRRIISFFLNVLVITSMVLGSFSTVIAQSGSDGTTSGSSPAAGSLGGTAAADMSGGDLAIRQGFSARYRATAGQTLRFDLDVAYPVEGDAYTWTLLNPPGNGEAVLNPGGASVTVAYTASAGFSGMDLFAVQVSDGSGQTARIGVMVEVSARASYTGARHPVNTTQWRPGVTTSQPSGVTAGALQQAEEPYRPEAELYLFARPKDEVPHYMPPRVDFRSIPETEDGLFFDESYGSDLTVEPPVVLEESSEEMHTEDVVPAGLTVVGLVLDSPITPENPFMWMAHQGLTDLVTMYNGDPADPQIDPKEYIKTEENTYAALFDQCAAESHMCIGVGYGMYDITVAKAIEYPSVKFVIIDSELPETPPSNLRGVVFRSDEAAYLAGLLATRMSGSNTVAAIGGMEIPPVTIFLRGFRNGAQCADSNSRVLVDYLNDFWDQDLGAQMAQDMMNYGADVIFPAAGPAGNGALFEATGAGNWAIGVDMDQYVSVFGSGSEPGADKMLTSVVKRVDTAVVESVEDLLFGTFSSETVSYGLAEEGVGLAPYHETVDDISQDVKDEIDALKAAIIAETVDVNNSCRNPQLGVDPDGDNVWGWGWPVFSNVTLTVGADEYSDTQRTDENGYVNFGYVGFDLPVGTLLTLDNGEFPKEHNLQYLTLDNIDLNENTVDGYAAAGMEVWIWACEDSQASCDGVYATADGTGYYIGDIDEADTPIDIIPGTDVAVHRFDEEGDVTVVGRHVPNPRFYVNLNSDYIYATEFTPQTRVDVYLNEEVDPLIWGTTDDSGNIMFGNQDIQPGTKVTVTDGTTTKVLDPVRDLTITGVDADTDIISGTAPAGSQVEMMVISDNSWSNRATFWATFDTSTTWVADFGTEIGWDITPGNFGFADIWDDDGDCTGVSWDYLEPSFDVDPDSNGVWGGGWPANSTITLTIGLDEYTSDSDDNGWVDFGQLPVDFQVGNTLTLSAGGYSKTHQILPFAVTGFNVEEDEIYGTAPAGAPVGAWGCDENYCEGDGGTALGDGTWMVDLSGIWDIQPGSNGGAHVTDVDGDGTHSGWYIPNPAFSVNPHDEGVWGWDWPSEEEIDITVTRGAAVVYNGTADIDSNRNFGTNTWPFDIQVGDVVAVSVDGGPAKTHEVLALTFDEYDETSESVRGTAPEGSQVKAWGCDDQMCEESDETFAGEFNTYEAFFPTLDIRRGTQGSVWRSDDDGDNTEIGWRVPNTGFAVNPNDEGVWGWEWPAGAEIDLIVTRASVEVYSMTIFADPGGNFGSGTWPFDIQVGDEVVLSVAGGPSKSHIVLEFTYNVDEGTDTVSGTAPDGSWVRLWARDNDSEYGTEVQADINGDWSFFFNDDDFYVDIKPGTEGNVGRWDDDGDGTEFYWRIPNPSIAVNPENNTVWGWEFPADTDVTLTITGKGTYDGRTNENGDFGFGDLGVDIVTGDEVNVSGGGASKEHTVMELHDISYSELDDTVSGIATEGEWVNVWACDYDNCNGIDWQAGTGGAFSADMTEIEIDIAPGTNGNVGRWDENGDGTVIDWRVPNPNFSVNPENNNVWGDEWLGNTDVTLTIGTFTRTVTSQGDGHVEFGEIPLDLGVGDHLVISDGENEKDHTILPFTITGVDEDTDVVTGTAPDNTWVDAWACDNNQCQGNGLETDGESWLIDLSDRWDIVKGTWGGARAVDNDGDGTQLDWYVPNPSFGVNPENDTVWGWQWPADTDVTLTITGKGTFDHHTNENGDFGFDPLGVDIVMGDELNVSGGGVSKDHTVMELHDISYDEDAETVSGIATENEWVNVWACDYDNCNGIDWKAGTLGAFSVDMTQIGIDIAPGTNGNVGRWDDDGDGTVIDWRVPNPAFSVNPENNNVWGDEWLGNTDVTLTIGAFTRTVPSNENGYVEFGDVGFDLVVGDHLVITDGENEKDHYIMPFAITEVDEDTDVVTGTAPGNTWVDAWGCDNSHCEGNGVVSEADGSWEVDLSDRWDIVKGNWGGARAVDNDGDGTQLDWYLPNPNIGVYPFENMVRGWDLTPGATANLTIGTYHDSATVDDNWYVEFYTANDPTPFDILPGQTVVVADGTNTRSVLVTNIAVTGFNEDEDLMFGTAAAGSAVVIGGYNESYTGLAYMFIADSSGNWTADFSGHLDIKEGTWGFLFQVDVDGDYTVVHWEVLPDAPANDLLAEAENLILPVSPININTSSATTSATDPALGTCLNWRYSLADKGQASVWYKYVATQDGALVIDTRGSDYDTALAVYSGTPSAASRIACNDDLSDYDMDSSLIATVRTGSTYYIEVVDTGFTQWKPEAGIQSMEVDVQEIPQTQAVGGELTLNVELQNCYTLTATASPATGGTVTRTPAPNCAGTKYAGGTKITLSALPKTTTNFLKWSDDNTENVRTFNIEEDTNLTATFVGIPGAVSLSSPASGALLHLEDVYPKTPITLKWLATSIPSVEYDWQVAQNNLFTDDLHAYVTTELQLQPDWLEADKTYYWKVRGINAAGGKGAWSAVRYFRVAVLKPDGLGVYDDADDETADDALYTNRPQFRWDAVDGASGYYVQIARNATFTSIVTSGTLTGGTNTAFTPAVNLPLPTATYPNLYWRVRANSSTRGPGLYAEGATFTVPPAPAMPLLTSPANNALTIDPTPPLNWSDVAGADGYEWQIARDAAFTEIYDNGTVDTIPLVSQADVEQALDPAATYYWRVRTLKSGMMSGWTAARSLRSAIEAPALTSPDDGEVLMHLRPTLDWEPVLDATGYTVQIARRIEPYVSLLGSYSRTAAQTEYTPTSNLPANTLLYWRVQTRSTAYGPSAWTDWRMMDMPNPPSTPYVYTPASNALLITEKDNLFDWSDSTVSGGAVLQKYEVGAFDATCTVYHPEHNEYVDSPVSNFLLLANEQPAGQTFGWAVRAINTAGEYSAWSPCRTFRTALKAPTLVDPPSNPVTMLETNRPTFTWQPVDGATSYTIQVSRSPGFSSILTSGTASGPSWSTPVTLPMVTLYWRVRANSAAYGPGAWSNQYDLPYWSFFPGAPLPIPVLLTPLHGALSTTQNPTFTWRITVPVGMTLSRYNIQIARDSAFVDKVMDDQTLTAIPTYIYEGDELEPGRTYYWRVSANFSSGLSGWTTARTLRIALPPPELTSPLDGENPYQLRPTFDWEGVEGATGYTLQISRNNTFTSLVGSYSRTALQTDYTPTSNLPANIPLFWRVQTKSTTYGPSAWSDPFMLDMPNPPGVPLLVSPASGATLTTRNPRLDWSNVTLPVGENWGRYEVQVATDSAFTNVVREEAVDGLITNSEYTVEDGLLSGTFYWRVRAFNTGAGPDSYDDEYSAWSAVRSFKVSAAVLRVGTNQGISTLDPVYAGNGTEISYLKSMYEGLTRYDENLETVSGAAKSWDYNDDVTELTFTLWPGLRYSDGSPLNAKRFEHAIQRYLATENAAFAGYLDMVDRVEARDPYGDLCSSYTQSNCLTLWMKFNRPAANVHTLMAMWFTYPAKVEKIAAGGDTWWANPANQVGNGPFKLSALAAFGKTVLLPNTYYRDGAPAYRMEYIYFTDDDQRLDAYRADALDVTWFNTRQVAEVVADPELNEEKRMDNGIGTQAMIFNLSKEPFSDPYIRQAFSLATDREALAEEVFDGSLNVNLSWIAPGFPGYDDEHNLWGYDAAAADLALIDSSYGAPASVPPVTVTYEKTPLNDSMWNWLKTHWEAELGVTVILDPVERDVFINARRNDELQLLIAGWNADNPDPQNWLSTVWPTGSYYANLTHYSNAAFDALIAQADGESDPVLRLELYRDAQRMLIDDMPLAPLFSTTNKFLVKPWVQGVLPAAMDSTWAGEQVPLAVSVQ